MEKDKLYILRAIAFIASAAILIFLIRYLGLFSSDKSFYQHLIEISLFFFSILMLLYWIAFGMVAALAALSVSVIFILLASAISRMNILNWYILVLASIAAVTYYQERRNNTLKGLLQAELEDIDKELNTLSDEYQRRQQQTKALQKRFSKFSILTDITEEMSSSLSLAEVANLIAKNSFNIIGKADICLLFLVDEKKHKLVLTSLRKVSELKNLKVDEADIFDQRVLKRKQPLIIQDIKKDYRFDYEMVKNRARQFRSLISTPLMTEDRAIGILRLDSTKPEIFDSEDLRLLNILADLGAVTVENAKLYERTEELAVTDGLTGCYVQRYMRQLAEEDMAKARESDNPLSLLMLDIDHFKRYNDTYGHIAGDIVLQGAAEIFMKLSPSRAVVARYGGEEFSIILPDYDSEQAKELAEKIRKKIKERVFFLRREKTSVTVSIGVATYNKEDKSVNEIIERADKALYKAKEQGRDKVCISS